MSCCVKCCPTDSTKGQKLTSSAGFETFLENYQTNQPTEADKRVITKKILIIMVLENIDFQKMLHSQEHLILKN